MIKKKTFLTKQWYEMNDWKEFAKAAIGAILLCVSIGSIFGYLFFNGIFGEGVLFGSLLGFIISIIDIGLFAIAKYKYEKFIENLEK